jgi:hypothetical protein
MFLGLSAQAEELAVSCSQMTNWMVANANKSVEMVNGIAQQKETPWISVDDDSLVFNEKDPRVIGFKKDGKKKTSVTFKRMGGKPVMSGGILVGFTPQEMKEKIDYDATSDDRAITYMGDPKFGNEAGKFGDKVAFRKDAHGNCFMVRSSMFMKNPVGNFQELVKKDKKFCDSVKSVLAEMGKETFDKCQGSLQKAAAAYDQRAKELETAQTKNGEPRPKFMSVGDNTLATTMEALQSCSPREWQDSPAAPAAMYFSSEDPKIPSKERKRSERGSKNADKGLPTQQ